MQQSAATDQRHNYQNVSKIHKNKQKQNHIQRFGANLQESGLFSR
jgi:hypothetical protein